MDFTIKGQFHFFQVFFQVRFIYPELQGTYMYFPTIKKKPP